ncbi:hypothetical protein PR048_001289 [Dryococelus australis]|uniref:Uncharacterized protein n=1 Tax=Dryococelus australis TaxID=614101 RepID=A0ABQ9IGZ1_9NEOP|nr:hypothetical protein PR048_001289 [Dryococelus australis]
MGQRAGMPVGDGRIEVRPPPPPTEPDLAWCSRLVREIHFSCGELHDAEEMWLLVFMGSLVGPHSYFLGRRNTEHYETTRSHRRAFTVATHFGTTRNGTVSLQAVYQALVGERRSNVLLSSDAILLACAAGVHGINGCFTSVVLGALCQRRRQIWQHCRFETWYGTCHEKLNVSYYQTWWEMWPCKAENAMTCTIVARMTAAVVDFSQAFAESGIAVSPVRALYLRRQLRPFRCNVGREVVGGWGPGLRRYGPITLSILPSAAAKVVGHRAAYFQVLLPRIGNEVTELQVDSYKHFFALHSFILWFIVRETDRVRGIAVAEWLADSPPAKANRVRSPARSLPDFRMWESCRKLVGGFSRGYPASPNFHSGATSYSPQSPSSALKTSLSIYVVQRTADLKGPTCLHCCHHFSAEKRGSYKGHTGTRYNCAIAATRMALNWRAVFSREVNLQAILTMANVKGESSLLASASKSYSASAMSSGSPELMVATAVPATSSGVVPAVSLTSSV